MAKESVKSFPAPALASEKITGVSLRRHSTGKPSSSKTKDYVPNYLRASTGSCHDLCKYGKHVAEDTQGLAPKYKRSTLAKSKPLPNGDSRNKASLAKVKSLPVSRTRSSDGLQVSKLKTCVSDTSKAEDLNISAKHGSSLNSKSSTSNRVGVMKIVTAPVASSRPFPGGVASSKPRKQWNLEIVSPLGYGNKVMKSEVNQHDHDEVHEKILYVITKETENPPESDQNEDCENKACGFDQYESFGSELSPPSPSTEEEDNPEEPMAKKAHSEETNEHENLSFRRGKVVDIEPEDRNEPRWLEFRRGRSWEENREINANTALTLIRSFKPREAEAETKNGDARSEQVVLRHQDVEEKRDAKGLLLNNVIEETASKLGGMQKSKVKALVGAFETVISLQDPKPLATTTVN